jgi:chaperonin GroES
MNVRPLADRILIRRLDAKEKVRGGIIIPDTAKEKPMEGEVVAVGPGKLSKEGKRVVLEVAKGDRVLIGKYSGTEVKIEGDDYVILREEDVLATISSSRSAASPKAAPKAAASAKGAKSTASSSRK